MARSFSRMILIGAAATTVIAGTWGAKARDLATMNADEIRLVQQRLTDAACYKGPVDGKVNAALETAQRFCPDQEPVLRIETGMHVAEIWRIGVDAQCRIAATASEDKTVRLWSMPSGRLLRTQRLPIGEGDNGKVRAVAISPDGRLVAAAGWDAHYAIDSKMGVYLFDTATGTNSRRVGAFENVILHLAFSPDGTKVAVALASGGVHVLDVASGQEVMVDTNYGDRSNGVAFGPDGSLYAVGYDGFLRRYGPDLNLTAKIPTLGGKKPYSVAVESSGRRLAVGYIDSSTVDIFDARDGRRITAADSRGVERIDLSVVGWSKDGTRLLAGGRAQALFNNNWHEFVRSWQPDGRRVGPDVPLSDSTISSLAPCRDAVMFSAQDPSFGLWQSDGTATTLQKGRTFDARVKLGEAFTISADGTQIRFGLGVGSKIPVQFDLRAATLLASPAAVAGLTQPNTGSLDVKDWQDLEHPLYNGRPIALDKYEISRSVAIRNDRAGFVLGADYWLRGIAANGKELWKQPVPGAAWGVNFARGGEIVAAAYGDGTIRWHRWSDGQELLALFVDSVSRHWVAWTPSGYYMASPGGEDLIGWHVNRGWDEPADFFPASRFRDRFNRPDIVELMLETLDESVAVRQANDAAHRRADTKPIEAALPPVLKIVTPQQGTTFSGATVELAYTVRSPSGLPIDKVDILIDGSPTGAFARGVDAATASKESQQTITIGLPPHDVDVGLVAKSGALTSEVAHVKLAYRGTPPAPQEADALKPVLYALLVGVAEYKDQKLQLAYPAKDAQDLATALQRQSGGLYRDVQVRVLTDKDATVNNVKDGLLWLQKETTSRDLAVVFLAGHGVTDSKNQFWYLPYEADASRLLTTAVSRADVMSVLGDLPGKKILFIDACHAGALLASNTHTRGASVDLNSAINDFATAESGLVVYGAATGRELSVESDEWHHGAFTKALIEAIGEGKADIAHKGKITTALLDAYLAERVKQLTGGEQHPVMSRPEAVPDFPFALVR